MKILVTGGSGFLGVQIIGRLRQEHEVWALSRSAASAQVATKAGATPLMGDLARVEGFMSQLSHFDAVVHAAAPVEFWGPWSKYQSGIVEATHQLAMACHRQGVKRFIHISSESVLQDKEALLDVDESHPFARSPNSFYGKAKKMAEQQLLSMETDMNLIILRPSFIWGPGSAALAMIAKKAESGSFVWADQGRAPFEAVHVQNVAEAVRLSLSQGIERGIYLVSDEEKGTVRDFFAAYFRSVGILIPSRSLPTWLINNLAGTCERLWNFFKFKGNPPLTRFDAAFVSMPRRYSTEKLRRELGYRPLVGRDEGWRQLAAEISGSGTS